VRSFVVAPRLAARGAAMQSKARPDASARRGGDRVAGVQPFRYQELLGRRFVVLEQQKKQEREG
jgi:hypothetical protein